MVCRHHNASTYYLKVVYFTSCLQLGSLAQRARSVSRAGDHQLSADLTFPNLTVSPTTRCIQHHLFLDQILRCHWHTAAGNFSHEDGLHHEAEDARSATLLPPLPSRRSLALQRYNPPLPLPRMKLGKIRRSDKQRLQLQYKSNHLL